ncbi:hypothetical protein C8Q74DRAFT_1371429 [Fomes fomentarius]|nr:hypothetical protein C8Q74DRAFT_1371429 [Fomes fomentarius]
MGPPLYSLRTTDLSPSLTLVDNTLQERSTSPPMRFDEIRAVLDDRNKDTSLWRALAHFYDNYHLDSFEELLFPHETVNSLLSVHLSLVKSRIQHDRLIPLVETFREVLESPDGQLESLVSEILADLQQSRSKLDDSLEIVEYALDDVGLVPVFQGLFPWIFHDHPATASQLPVPSSPLIQQARLGQPRLLAGTTHPCSPTPFERRLCPQCNSNLENISPTPAMAGSPTGQDPMLAALSHHFPLLVMPAKKRLTWVTPHRHYQFRRQARIQVPIAPHSQIEPIFQYLLRCQMSPRRPRPYNAGFAWAMDMTTSHALTGSVQAVVSAPRSHS